MDGQLADGATPLDLEEEAELIPRHISTRAELNTWEQANIAKAVVWLGARRRRGPVLSLAFLRELHQRMFGETWRWAGQFRRTGKNIGIPNGRHARLMADALLEETGRPPLTWGSGSLVVGGATREAYIEALLRADRGDYGPLLAFVRS